MKSFALFLTTIFVLLPFMVSVGYSYPGDGYDLCPAGAKMSDYADTWRNGEWELRITEWGDVTMTRYSDYHYRGQSDYPFRLQRDYSSPSNYSIEGRYTVSGKDGTFRGRMTLYFCYESSRDQLCGHYAVDGGSSTSWRTFFRY